MKTFNELKYLTQKDLFNYLIQDYGEGNCTMQQILSVAQQYGYHNRFKEEKQRLTYPDTNLRSKHFKTEQEMLEWANSPNGTDYIVSIVKNAANGEFILFYIEE